MTATQIQPKSELISSLINGILAIKPLANLAKHQAREMMIKRAEKLGVPWRENVQKLRSHDWEKERLAIENPQVTYPDYYVRSFHGYEMGDLCWEAALEFESAAYTVHSTIWQKTDGISIKGDSRLRQNYHQVLLEQLSIQPKDILDVGCSIGMSTFAIAQAYPQAQITGIDLSPYFLAVANYRSQTQNIPINWVHTAAEATGLPDNSFDLVSAFLIFHELPQKAAKEIFREARRLLRKGGYFAMMDMNPDSQAYKTMPPYVFTLLKSTEPHLDEYFTLDVQTALIEAGFHSPTITPISPRHRTIIAQKLEN
ncbi:Methyltransferase type 11 [Gloeothece citriformis PCC 7424]|uniref:Methyltransferase type 11 n=1 Tax=Gloeothece citriformis (strain PCC 7424) TaxID=65393 RepID=B7KKP1_GLOC7|nr:class I SAM-dependent methyltransferase [Gloeothece citriformis]ACK71010.1 Methyltransferase type 11 [Gloeothece citriformis PCC 7424]